LLGLEGDGMGRLVVINEHGRSSVSMTGSVTSSGLTIHGPEGQSMIRLDRLAQWAGLSLSSGTGEYRVSMENVAPSPKGRGDSGSIKLWGKGNQTLWRRP